jgi:hypothetical protein
VLVFDYDNSGNKETISRTMEYSTTKKVISRSLIENKFHVGAEYEYKGELSAKLSLKKIGEVSSKIESRVHIDTANDLVTSCEENKEIDETFTDSQVYKIAGGSRLTLYQLCYDMDGASCKTGVLVSTPGTAPGPEVKVDVTFTCTTSILGFTDILDRLFNTHPGSQNTAEWASIRQCITQNRDGTAEDAFYALVNTLNNIRPLSANTAEWTNIRAACTQILRDWKHTDKTLLLKVLLSQFADTFPSHDNRDEWEAIRNTSNAILGALKAVWAEPESIAA